MGRIVVDQERVARRPLQLQLVDDVEAMGHTHKEARSSGDRGGEDVNSDVDLSDQRHQEQPDLDAQRLVSDPTYMPLQPDQGLQPGDPQQPGGALQPPSEVPPLLQHPPFLQARQLHEMLERPHHVQRQEVLRGHQINFVQDSINFVDYVFAVTLPEPINHKEWRAIVKDPSKFVAKKVAKGVEVSYQRLNEEQRRAMKEAKNLEISEWLGSKVCQAAVGHLPPDRLMKMRWVLTFKQADAPGRVKAKARLVVLGFTDPDYGAVNVRSPTLSRRGRQLFLQAGVHRRWQMMKASRREDGFSPRTCFAATTPKFWHASQRASRSYESGRTSSSAISQSSLWDHHCTTRVLPVRPRHFGWTWSGTLEDRAVYLATTSPQCQHWTPRDDWSGGSPCRRLPVVGRRVEQQVDRLPRGLPQVYEMVTMGGGTFSTLWSSVVPKEQWQLDSEPMRVLRRAQSS
eukprot:s464_g15.t1